MKVIITDEARQDLFLIGDYIAEGNPDRALTFMEELEVRCFAISDFPQSSALLPRHESAGIRRAVHGNYGIFYTVTEAVYILRILNGTMDYERILFPEE